jgi:hypothetical protein
MQNLMSDLANLEACGTPALQQRWRELIGTEPPAYARAEILRLGMAYHLQAKAYGGLPQAVERRLLRLAARPRAMDSAAPVAAPRIKPGTRLLRRWRGEVHEVKALDRGFQYRGNSYASLSEIARTITETRWSGPAFFGLRRALPR